MSVTNQKLKREYLRKYFNKFTRLNNQGEKKFYNIYTDQPALCCHYHDMVNGRDLMIYYVWFSTKRWYNFCKNCNEYLCNEVFWIKDL